MDLYDLLGLPKGATLIEIKRSYRRLARKYHPDINPGDNAAEARFKEITRAYETLSDPDQRLRYDAAGSMTETTTVTFGFEGFDFSPSGQSAGTTFGDLFAEVFTQRQDGRFRQNPERGADLHASLTLRFDEAIQGAQRQLALNRRETCHACRGIGSLKVPESPCRNCEGIGTLRTRRGSMVFSKTCDVCEGTGLQTHITCNTCGGAGTESRSETVTVRIPAGVADGVRVRIPEKGNAGLRGGRAGDLFILVHVEPDETFRREGDDLHTVISIAVHEAALGAKIDVPAPDGPARVRVPPGTQTGQRFRLRGRGAPSPRHGERGDLVVEVKIMLPKVLDERSKELLKEFGRINGEDVRREKNR